MKSRDDIIKELAKIYNCDPSVFKYLQLRNEERNKSVIPEVPSMIFTSLELKE